MAFLRRSSAILRSALPRLQLQEPTTHLLPQKPHGESLLRSFSPCFGARFMCSVPSTKLFVGGLAWGMDENSLRDAFTEFGEVVEAKVVLDRDSGRSKGFGFVSFTCTDHAEAAKNGLDGKVSSAKPKRYVLLWFVEVITQVVIVFLQLLNGRTLRVNFAIEKQRGFGSFGGYGGGGYGGGDSGSSFGNSTFNSGPPGNSSSFSSGDSLNQANDNFYSNNTFNQESLNNVGNNDSDKSSGKDDNFFGDDAFDDGGDGAFGKDGNFAQGIK